MGSNEDIGQKAYELIGSIVSRLLSENPDTGMKN